VNPRWRVENNIYWAKIKGSAPLRDRVYRQPDYWLHGSRHREGKTCIQALIRNRRSRVGDDKQKCQKSVIEKAESSDALTLWQMKS